MPSSLSLYRWDQTKPASVSNLILLKFDEVCIIQALFLLVLQHELTEKISDRKDAWTDGKCTFRSYT